MKVAVESHVAALIDRVWQAFGDRKAEVHFLQTPTGVTVRGSFDPETTHAVEYRQAGWQAILQNFARYVAAGK